MNREVVRKFKGTSSSESVSLPPSELSWPLKSISPSSSESAVISRSRGEDDLRSSYSALARLVALGFEMSRFVLQQYLFCSCDVGHHLQTLVHASIILPVTCKSKTDEFVGCAFSHFVKHHTETSTFVHVLLRQQDQAKLAKNKEEKYAGCQKRTVCHVSVQEISFLCVLQLRSVPALQQIFITIFKVADYHAQSGVLHCTLLYSNKKPGRYHIKN